jgi:hypothetical protein
VYCGRPIAITALTVVPNAESHTPGKKSFDVTEEGREMGKFLTYVIGSMGVHLEY